MSNEKAPGLNGIPVELYENNISWMSDEFLQIYTEAINMSLQVDINSSLIKLIPKEGDRTFIKTWRPITLLNGSYQILAKILALRLENILPHIINPSQTRFVNGRSILEILITFCRLWIMVGNLISRPTCFSWAMRKHTAKLNGSLFP